MNKLTKLWCSLSARWLYLAGALVIAGLFGAALYLQYVLHQEPCSLCMVQRLVFIAMLALGGAGVASRHIWIQHLPKDEASACGPGLDYMLENFPVSEVWKELMHGSGECAEKGWTFLALGIPEWSLVWYVLLGAWAVLLAFRKPA